MIDLDRLDASLRTFFREELTAAGASLRAAGHAVPLHPDEREESYYERRSGNEPLIFSEADVDVSRIGEHWQRTGRGELAPLARHVEALRAAVPPAPESADVSSFIYAMF